MWCKFLAQSSKLQNWNQKYLFFAKDIFFAQITSLILCIIDIFPFYSQESYIDFNFMVTLQIVEEFSNVMTFFFLGIQDDLINGYLHHLWLHKFLGQRPFVWLYVFDEWYWEVFMFLTRSCWNWLHLIF
jgi:hypothetical protein